MDNNKNKRVFGKTIDWQIILIWGLLCVIGCLNVRAAVFDPDHPSLFSLETNYGKQSLFFLVSGVVAFFILVIESRFFKFISPILYIVTMLLLVLVLLIGQNISGNQAWISLGPFKLQPSEFAKLGACLLLAKFFDSQGKPSALKVLTVGGLILLFPVGLIMLQPDTGSALTFFALVLVFYREGYVSGKVLAFGLLCVFLFIISLLISKWIIIVSLALIYGLGSYFLGRHKGEAIKIGVLLFLASVAFVFFVDFAYNHILQPHQRNRIDVILGKIEDARGQGYNLNQSKIAIGSGQLFGKGYLQGTQTKYNFVPEQSTDFIFCTVGEEWGFVGAMIIVSLYLGLLLKLVQLAERQRSTFARVYGYGVSSILFFHFLINIGMTIGLVPVIGIPLPFLSYGGSSLLSFTVLLFIMIKFDSSRKGLI